MFRRLLPKYHNFRHYFTIITVFRPDLNKKIPLKKLFTFYLDYISLRPGVIKKKTRYNQPICRRIFLWSERCNVAFQGLLW